MELKELRQNNEQQLNEHLGSRLGREARDPLHNPAHQVQRIAIGAKQDVLAVIERSAIQAYAACPPAQHAPGLEQRDRLVLGKLREKGVPVAVTLSGGYARKVEDTIQIHTNTLRIACEVSRQ